MEKGESHMNIQQEIAILSSTYWHLMTIEREEVIEEEWGEKTSTGEYIEISSNISCAFSSTTGRNTNQTSGSNDIQYDGIVFCDPDVDIQTGDRVVVTFENGLSRKYDAGEPQYYPSHWEIPVIREDKA